MAKRVLDVYYDVQEKALVDESTGNRIPSASWPELNYTEKCILNLHLVDGDPTTPYTGLDGTESFSFAVDDDFDADSTVMCRTANSGINGIGDWYAGEDSSSGGIQADPLLGEVSVEIDCNTTQYRDALGVNEKRNAWMELKVYDGSDVIQVFRWKIVAYGLIDPAGANPGSVSSSGSGTSTIASGVAEHTVSGLGLSYSPSSVVVSVEKPIGGLNIFATVRAGTTTSDGFTVDLSGLTDSASYILHFVYWQ